MNLTRVTNSLTILNATTTSICKRFSKICQHMALVGIYHVIEELSYFYFFSQNKNPKYFCSKKQGLFDHTSMAVGRHHYSLVIVNPCCSVIIRCSIARPLADHLILVFPWAHIPAIAARHMGCTFLPCGTIWISTTYAPPWLRLARESRC